ncbi:MAG: NUDIX domain-containing protein [Anaerolineae bacterium]
MTSTGVIAKTTQTYNALAHHYTQKLLTFTLDEQIDRFSGYLKPGGLILDLGCGPGRDIHAFQKRGFRVVGLDRSAGMLAEAAKRGAGPLVLADMRRLPFARHSFKGVWASASLLHLPNADLTPALTGINRALDHGHLYLSVKEGQAEAWRGHGEHGRRFFSDYHPAEVELALERADFHVLWAQRSPDGAGRDTGWINAIGWTKLTTPRVGANAIIFNAKGQVLLTRRSDNGQWCAPGGHLDFGESIEQAAIREAREETGLTVEIERLSGMYNVHYPAHIFPERKGRAIFMVAFRCRIVDGTLTLNEEVTEFGWFDPHHLPPDLLLNHRQRILDAAEP